MLFQTKLVVLRKTVYQNALLVFEKRLNVDFLLSCLGSPNMLLVIKSRSI